MPIRVDQKWFYRIDWRELSRVIRFDRAQGRCERCARLHSQWVTRDTSGRWWDETRQRWRDSRGRIARALPDPARRAAAQPPFIGFDVRPMPQTLMVLAAAHLDHDPGNNDVRNLVSLCQRCHLAHDRGEHRRQRWATLFYRRAVGDLFTGQYRRDKSGGP